MQISPSEAYSGIHNMWFFHDSARLFKHFSWGGSNAFRQVICTNVLSFLGKEDHCFIYN